MSGRVQAQCMLFVTTCTTTPRPTPAAQTQPAHQPTSPPVHNLGGAVGVVGQEELPHAVVILDGPVLGARLPGIELANQRQRLWGVGTQGARQGVRQAGGRGGGGCERSVANRAEQGTAEQSRAQQSRVAEWSKRSPAAGAADQCEANTAVDCSNRGCRLPYLGCGRPLAVPDAGLALVLPAVEPVEAVACGQGEAQRSRGKHGEQEHCHTQRQLTAPKHHHIKAPSPEPPPQDRPPASGAPWVNLSRPPSLSSIAWRIDLNTCQRYCRRRAGRGRGREGGDDAAGRAFHAACMRRVPDTHVFRHCCSTQHNTMKKRLTKSTRAPSQPSPCACAHPP